MEIYRAWKVSYKVSDNIYCTNIVKGTYSSVESYYQNKGKVISITKATMSDEIEADYKSMPIVKLA